MAAMRDASAKLNDVPRFHSDPGKQDPKDGGKALATLAGPGGGKALPRSAARAAASSLPASASCSDAAAGTVEGG